MAVGDDGRDRAHRRRARAGVVVALEATPAVVRAADAGDFEVHFLDRALADIADQQVAGLAVEAPAPRVAQSVAPDLVAGGGDRAAAGTGLPDRDGVGGLQPEPRFAAHRRTRRRRDRVDVQPQHLALQGARVRIAVGGGRRVEETGVGGAIITDAAAGAAAEVGRRQGLRAIARIAAAAAVAEAEIEVAVRSEGDVAAVVVAEILVDAQDHGARGLVGRGHDVGRGRGHRIAQQDGIAVLVGDADEDAAVVLEIRMEGEAQQAALAAAGEADRDRRARARVAAGDEVLAAVGEREHRGRQQHAVADHAHRAALLDHEQAPAAVAGVHHADRAGEAAQVVLEHLQDRLRGGGQRNEAKGQRGQSEGMRARGHGAIPGGRRPLCSNRGLRGL